MRCPLERRWNCRCVDEDGTRREPCPYEQGEVHEMRSPWVEDERA